MSGSKIKDDVPELEAIRTFLQAHAPTGVRLQALRVKRIRTKASKGPRILYHAQSEGNDDGGLYFFARHVSQPEGHRHEQMINQQFQNTEPGLFSQGFQKAALYSPEFNLLFQIFPADRRLPCLVKAADPEFMKRVFQDFYRGKIPEQALTSVAISVVQYKPGRSCLLRYGLNWEQASRQPGPMPFLYGKVYRNPERAHTNFAKLVKISDALRGAMFQPPRPVTCRPDLCMELTAHVPGRHLSGMYAEKEFPALCRLVGEGLAEFHEAPVILEKDQNPQTLIAEMTQWGREFARACPEQALRIRKVTQMIGQALANRLAPGTLVHGDFHLANILVDGRKLGLIDFENCYMGNPAADVGFFYAQIKLLAIKASDDPSVADTALYGFLDGYLNRRRYNYPSDIQTYAAFSCLWCAYFQCIQRPEKPRWLERAMVMLQISEEILERGLF